MLLASCSPPALTNLTKRHWLEFGEYCRLPKRALTSLFADQVGALDTSIEMIGRSLLPQKQKAAFERIIRANNVTLSSTR
jgi:hypothetical protein